MTKRILSRALVKSCSRVAVSKAGVVCPSCHGLTLHNKSWVESAMDPQLQIRGAGCSTSLHSAQSPRQRCQHPAGQDLAL
jgi:hypothetical protein